MLFELRPFARRCAISSPDLISGIFSTGNAVTFNEIPHSFKSGWNNNGFSNDLIVC